MREVGPGSPAPFRPHPSPLAVREMTSPPAARFSPAEAGRVQSLPEMTGDQLRRSVPRIEHARPSPPAILRPSPFPVTAGPSRHDDIGMGPRLASRVDPRRPRSSSSWRRGGLDGLFDNPTSIEDGGSSRAVPSRASSSRIGPNQSPRFRTRRTDFPVPSGAKRSQSAGAPRGAKPFESTQLFDWSEESVVCPVPGKAHRADAAWRPAPTEVPSPVSRAAGVRARRAIPDRSRETKPIRRCAARSEAI